MSLGAVFGALVWIFQDGNLSGVLGFHAFGAIEAWVPVIVFVFAFGLSIGRGWGFPPSGGPAAPVTAVLVAEGENEQSWLRAGQALQRILLRAASNWVFASLQSQPLQSPSVRAQIRSSLRATGSPQMLLELGVARTSRPTARRPVDELTPDR